MTPQVIQELEKKGLMDGDCPSLEAIKIAIGTVDQTSNTAREIYEHADICPRCSLKFEEAR